MAIDVDLRDLRYFVAVAEEGSFSQAARHRLFVSQPALSKQIRVLERLLRARLFDRTSRSVTLTAAGAALLPRARQLLADWERARSEVDMVVAASESTLRVGFQTRIGRGIVPTVTEQLRRELPGWQLAFRQIPWADPTVGLGSGDIDVAVAWLPVPDPTAYAWRVVTTEPRWVALPGGHRLAAQATVAFDQLLEEPVVALPVTAGPQRDFWLASAHRPTPARVALEVETAEEAFEAVAAGRGVALVAEGNAQIYTRDEVVFRPVSGLPPSELAVWWRVGDERPAVALFAESLEACTLALPTDPVS